MYCIGLLNSSKLRDFAQDIREYFSIDQVLSSTSITKFSGTANRMNIVISSSSDRTNNNFLIRNRVLLYKDEEKVK